MEYRWISVGIEVGSSSGESNLAQFSNIYVPYHSSVIHRVFSSYSNTNVGDHMKILLALVSTSSTTSRYEYRMLKRNGIAARLVERSLVGAKC